MKESYGEGVATHTDPESCGAVRKGEREALTGARAGRVLSRERTFTPGCRRCKEKRKATPGASLSRDAAGPRAVRDPVHVRKHLAREPGDPVLCPWRMALRAASGSLRTYADDERAREVGQPRSTCEVRRTMPGNRRRRGWREGGLAKGNPREQNAPRTQSRTGAPSALERVRQAARRDRKTRFTALLHHVYDLDALRAAYFALKREAAPGVDGETWRHYGEALEENLQDLSERLKRGAYRAKPVRRVYIPKADGRQRPLGVTALEDKIVQRATVEVLNAIYETDFLGFSYGFRPGRSQHQCAGRALRSDPDEEGELGARRRHPWVLRYHRPRMAGEVHRAPDRGPARRAAHPEMVERRRAGRWEADTKWRRGRRRAAVHRRCWRTSTCTTCSTSGSRHGDRSKRSGDVIVVRFADDIVLGFQHRVGCRAVPDGAARAISRSSAWSCIPRRRACSSSAASRPTTGKTRGQGKPETFNFLGFTHICGKKRSNGRFTVLRQTMRKRLQAKLRR